MLFHTYQKLSNRTHTNPDLLTHVHTQTREKSGKGKTVIEFKEALEKVLDCDECGQEVCSNSRIHSSSHEFADCSLPKIFCAWQFSTLKFAV